LQGDIQQWILSPGLHVVSVEAAEIDVAKATNVKMVNLSMVDLVKGGILLATSGM